ncbi:MAG TPA: rRNA maturation RNase YbeY [Pricia sp.]|nr:rRNA maturation RNase YbeY [Pricia sp.]
MIEFHYETEFRLDNKARFADWVSRVIASESGKPSAINYIFCSDAYLLELNKKHLAHDTLTDILTFDTSTGKKVGGDIFISVERVTENAETYGTTFEDELLRVMAHGLLHIFGYKDRTESDTIQMRDKEDEKIQLFHVEQ